MGTRHGSHAGGTSADFEDAFPQQGTPVGFEDTNGDMAPGNLDAQGNIRVSVSGAGSGGTSSNFDDPFPASGTAAGAYNVSSGEMKPLVVDDAGNLLTSSSPSLASTSATTNVPVNAGNVTLLGANAARKGFYLYNDTPDYCLVKMGVTASATSYTKKMAPGDNLSTVDLGVNYDGQIDAIWESATSGAMRVTELT